MEGAAAQQSATTQALKNQVADLRAHAGLTAVHGPGVEVDLGNATPAQQMRGDRRVRTASYRVETNVEIRSVVTAVPFVYATGS